MNKPFSSAAEQNKEVILKVLQQESSNQNGLLEIGSGTGQHAVYMAPQLPHLNWQPSDIADTMDAINSWLHETTANNILQPIELDVCGKWPELEVDLIYTCNTLHILSKTEVECLFKGSSSTLKKNGKLIIYGPFNKNGNYTSASNAHFDQWLKQQNINYGIRDIEYLNELAVKFGFSFYREYVMPANNLIMIWTLN